MAKKEVVRKFCDRHGGTRKPATQTRSWSYDGDRYAIDLCDEHGAMFDRDMGAWARMSREVVDTTWDASRPLLATKERSVDRAARKLASASVVKPDMDGTVVVQRLPASYHLWTLTEHAKQRCGERGVTERDALITAADPAYTFNHPDHQDQPELRHHVRGEVAVLVNTERRAVVTVMTASSLEEREGVTGG